MSEPFETQCHCGAVRLQVPAPPTQVTSCNCSLCFKLGTLWGYYAPQDLTFVEGAGLTQTYVQGDRMLETHRCSSCGCVTHWVGIVGPAIGRVGLNVRLGDRKLVEAIPVKWLNGAGNWEVLDGPGGG
jgi:hypothetical protein